MGATIGRIGNLMAANNFHPVGASAPESPETDAREPGSADPQGSEAERAGLVAIGPVGSERKAREWALVLESMRIEHVLRFGLGGHVLLVRDADYERAASSIDRYESENRDWPPPRTRERALYRGALFAPLLFAAAVVFFFVTGPSSGGSRFFSEGASVASLVVSSEPFRAVTALTLHADGAHVLGNAISGSIFVAATERRLGPGAAALGLVASGTLGNVANAVYHQATGSPHASIGASTAVFGAVGILAATQLFQNRKDGATRGPQGRLALVAPVVGGLALLGALGASPNSDLGAHLFGLLAGLLVGTVAALFLRGRARPWLQPALGALAALVVLGSWQLAFLR